MRNDERFAFNDGYAQAVGDVVRYLRRTASHVAAHEAAVQRALANEIEGGVAGKPRYEASPIPGHRCPGLHWKKARTNRKLCQDIAELNEALRQ